MKALTLADLIHNFLADPKIPERRKSMTKSSCRHAAKALGYETNSDFPVHKIHSAQKALSTYLETTQLSPRSRTNYQSYFRRFVNWCEDNHLLPRKLQNKLTLEWLDLTHPLKGVASGRTGWRGALRKLGYWATGFGIQPADLTHEHLRAYVDFLKSESGVCAWAQIYHRTRKEWNHHAMEGLVHELVWPILPSSVRSTYAIKIEKWPREMQEEYKIYRAWCTDDFRLKRPLRYKHRESTAKQNLEMMQRIAGYTHYTCELPLKDLDMTLFFDQTLISGYMQWLVTDRNNGKKPEQLKGIITQLLGMANGYFERLDATEWLLPLKVEVSGAVVRDMKQLAFTIQELYDVADGIRDQRLLQIKRAKAKYTTPDKRRQARLVMFELIMRLFIERLLRRSNVCEIRLRVNLIKTGEHSYFLKFAPEDMKSGKMLEFSFPDSLVSLLEDYMKNYRSHLCDGYDSDYLFPARAEGHVSGATVLNFIRRHSLRIVGKPLFPHLIRHSVAIEFLKEYPGDYLTLSKMLHHSSVEITINQYGHYSSDDAAEAFDKMMKLKNDKSTAA